MGIVTGVACQGAKGSERLPQDSICAQAHIGVILCRVAFWRESIITRRFSGRGILQRCGKPRFDLALAAPVLQRAPPAPKDQRRLYVYLNQTSRSG